MKDFYNGFFQSTPAQTKNENEPNDLTEKAIARNRAIKNNDFPKFEMLDVSKDIHTSDLVDSDTYGRLNDMEELDESEVNELLGDVWIDF